MQYPGTEITFTGISSRVSLRPLFLARPFPMVPDHSLWSLCPLASKNGHHTHSVLLLGVGDAELNDTNVVSILWTLPFSSLSLNFYRISPGTMRFGDLIVYFLHSYFKLYVYMCVSEYCCGKLLTYENSDILGI